VIALLRRDLLLAARSLGDLLLVVAFFVLVAALFPFGVGAERTLLVRLAPGVLWVAALLAVLLSLDRLFAADQEAGDLDLLLLGGLPAPLLILVKALAHWLTTGLPLIVAAPLVAQLYQLPGESLPVLLASLLLGTPTLSLLGAVGAALCLGARRGGVLLPLLLLPLWIPVLIFGTGAMEAGLSGLSPRPHLLLLGALLALSLPLAAVTGALALRQAAE